MTKFNKYSERKFYNFFIYISTIWDGFKKKKTKATSIKRD